LALAGDGVLVLAVGLLSGEFADGLEGGFPGADADAVDGALTIPLRLQRLESRGVGPAPRSFRFLRCHALYRAAKGRILSSGILADFLHLLSSLFDTIGAASCALTQLDLLERS